MHLLNPMHSFTHRKPTSLTKFDFSSLSQLGLHHAAWIPSDWVLSRPVNLWSLYWFLKTFDPQTQSAMQCTEAAHRQRHLRKKKFAQKLFPLNNLMDAKLKEQTTQRFLKFSQRRSKGCFAVFAWSKTSVHVQLTFKRCSISQSSLSQTSSTQSCSCHVDDNTEFQGPKGSVTAVLTKLISVRVNFNVGWKREWTKWWCTDVLSLLVKRIIDPGVFQSARGLRIVFRWSLLCVILVIRGSISWCGHLKKWSCLL